MISSKSNPRPFPVKTIPGQVSSRPGTRGNLPSLRRCQVVTPYPVVSAAWRLCTKGRFKPHTVLDLGAGDGRFALYGKYGSYLGYELDPKVRTLTLPRNAKIRCRDALEAKGEFELAIGNPPFMRVQDLDSLWRDRARRLIKQEAGVDPGPLGNLACYFLWFATLRTSADGRVCMVLPSDWIQKAATRALRSYILKHKWKVTLFELPSTVDFDIGKRANAGITLIEKNESCSTVSLVKLRADLRPRKGGGSRRLISTRGHSPRSDHLYAFRGLSPGSRNWFVLTEAERIEARIPLDAVWPAVGTLRPLPNTFTTLTRAAFTARYVRAGLRCWLLRTDSPGLDSAVRAWLDSVPKSIQENSTCGARAVWYDYTVPIPGKVLYSSAYSSSRGLKVVSNPSGVVHLGTVHAIHIGTPRQSPSRLVNYLKSWNFARGSVPWVGGMRRIEVGQMNSILSAYTESPRSAGR